jgi:hypothetical protein
MESVFSIGNDEASTDAMLGQIEVEYHRRFRREAQRARRAVQDDHQRELTREADSAARQVARAQQTDEERATHRTVNTAGRAASRNPAVQSPNAEKWWERVHQLNLSQVDEINILY